MAKKLSELTGYQRYYLEGFARSQFKDTETLASLKASLFDICNENLKDDFSLVQKYHNTKDLRPEAFEYDSSFINILIENNIPELLRSHVGKDLTLNHIQVRVSDFEVTQSYMPWHRDSYVMDDELIGCIPPAHKIIFYPIVPNTQKRDCLALVKGSHICTFQNQKKDQFVLPGCSSFDTEIMKISNISTYSSSEDGFLMFNSALLHHAIPSEKSEKNIRIIYSFVEKSQFNDIYASKIGHLKLNNIYENTIAAKEL